MVTPERLRELLDYDPVAGQLVWKVHRNSYGGKVKPGVVAGGIGTHGYRLIRVDGYLRQAHRWVWLWHTGAWLDPEVDIDHANGDRDDNHIENLRVASRAQNMWNGKTRADNQSGYPGVAKPKGRDKWDARIIVEGKFHFLGAFDTFEEAVAARKAAEKLLHGQYRRER